MKIRYEIKPKEDRIVLGEGLWAQMKGNRKINYNVAGFSSAMINQVFSDLFFPDPTRTIKIVYENKV